MLAYVRRFLPPLSAAAFLSPLFPIVSDKVILSGSKLSLMTGADQPCFFQTLMMFGIPLPARSPTSIRLNILISVLAGIRTFSFGWHAKTNIACWISTITIYNIIPLLIIKITIPNFIGYVILGIALLSMVIWAPADTPKRPLIRKEQRLKAKILSILVITLYFIIYLITDIQIIKNSILYAITIQTILVNPLTYKLTNTQFNNYKYYKKRTK